MNIHEYQAKAILAKYGVAVPKGKVADIPLEAEVIAMEFGTPVVIKAQIHAGGRGKGGGIKLAKTPEEAMAFMPYQARNLAFGLSIPPELTVKAVKFMMGLYKAFVDTECSLAEINPLVLTEDGDVLALDAKMNFDGNGLFRHKDIQALRDFDEEDPTETEASKFDVSYIRLDGTIGCMVHGAGLAMGAT